MEWRRISLWPCSGRRILARKGLRADVSVESVKKLRRREIRSKGDGVFSLSNDQERFWNIQPLLGLVIDLTNTTRYYSSSEWTNQGIKHVKIACKVCDAVPDNESVNTFVYEALHIFAQARPPGIYKQDYIESLYMFYHESPENLFYPPIPEWKRSSDLDLNGEAVKEDDDDRDTATFLNVGAS